MRSGFVSRMKKERDGHVKTRMLAVYMYKTPKEDKTMRTCKEVAECLGMSPSWVSKQLKKYRTGGIKALYDQPRSGAPRKIDHDIVRKILKKWRTGKLDSKKIVAEYYRLTGKKMSRSYARELARQHGYSSKRPRRLYDNSASPSAVIRWQRENLPVILGLMAAGFVLVAEDEASFILDKAGKKSYYAPPGRAAAVAVGRRRGKITAAGLVSEAGENGRSRRVHVLGKNPNSAMFIELCKKALKVFGLVVMIVDKASWHHSKAVARFVEEQGGALQIIVLPTSSSWMNIKEGDWRQARMDEYLAVHFNSTKELKRNLVLVLNTRLNRRRSVLKWLRRSPYKNNERSFKDLSTYTVND